MQTARDIMKSCQRDPPRSAAAGLIEPRLPSIPPLPRRYRKLLSQVFVKTWLLAQPPSRSIFSLLRISCAIQGPIRTRPQGASCSPKRVPAPHALVCSYLVFEGM